MHGFKSAILEKLKNCQNGTFESKNLYRQCDLEKNYVYGVVLKPTLQL